MAPLTLGKTRGKGLLQCEEEQKKISDLLIHTSRQNTEGNKTWCIHYLNKLYKWKADKNVLQSL